MYEISDAIELALFTLRYACALLGTLIAVQLIVIGGGTDFASSNQTRSALAHQEKQRAGGRQLPLLSPQSKVETSHPF